MDALYPTAELALPLGFGFGSAAMLGWLAAAAAPIMIHLWMRHTHRQTPWAAMRFLEAVIKRNSRRLRLQHWLLLAIRTLIVLLLVLATAKPYLESLGGYFGGIGVHRILVIDGSLSMRARVGETTSFERAIAAAQQILGQAGPRDVFSLVLWATPSEVLIGPPVAGTQRVEAQLSRLAPTTAAADASSLLTILRPILEAKTATNMPRRVELITDLAAHGWNAGRPTSEPDSGTLADLEPIAKLAEFAVWPIAGELGGNLAVVDVRLDSSLQVAGAPLLVRATVAGAADSTVDTTVSLRVDDRELQSRPVRVAAGDRSPLVLEGRVAEPGIHTVGIRLGGDALPDDDQRLLVAEVRSNWRVLLVEGQQGSADFLKRALAPDPAAPGALLPVVIPDGRLGEQLLADFACVMLLDLPRLTAGESEQLANYLRVGGGVVVWFGAAADESYLRLAPEGQSNGDSAASSRWLPVLLGPAQSVAAGELNPLDYDHPLVVPFRNQPRSGLITTPVSTIRKIAPVAAGKTALASSDGAPVLVTGQFGQGQVTVVAVPPTLDAVDGAGQPWSLWPAWPSFLPVVREMVLLSASSRQSPQCEVGEPIELAVPPGVSQLTVDRPDERRDPIVVPGGNATVRYESVDVPGIYAFVDATSGTELTRVAVNLPASESDLRRLDPKSLPDWIQTATSVADQPTKSAAATLHGPMLATALALMVIETLLAMWFGRGGA